MALLLRNRGAILLLMINIFLIFTGIGLVIPIMPTYMNELHISGSVVGLLVAAFSLTQLVFSPLAGKLSDKMGRKKIIVVGMLVFAVSEWLFGFSNGAFMLFIARMLGGIGGALIMPAVMAYTADVTTMKDRAKGMGFINAAITTGFIIGPGVGGYIAEFGIRVPFYGAAIAGLIAAVVTLIILPESKRKQATEKPHNPSETVASPEKKTNIFRQVLQSYREPYFLSLIIILVVSFGLSNYETVFGLFVDHRYGFTAKDIAFIITFGSIAGAVVQFTVFGWILNTFGEEKVVSFCLLVASISIALTLLVSVYWLIVLVTFIVFLSIDILRPTISTQISRMADDQQGYIAGLNSAFTSFGNIVGPIIAGLLFDININYPFLSASLVLFLCFLLSLRAIRKLKAA